MTDGYVEELVYAQSEDGILLDGAVIRPTRASAGSVSIVWIHGMASRFSAPTTVHIGREVARCGYAFVTGNNRGHDFGAMVREASGKSVLRGGGWELFGEAPRDVAGWIDFAMDRGSRGVVLVGHSLGAMKATFYLAERSDPRVLALIAASPGVKAGRVYRDADVVALAERMVSEGQGADLLPWGISPYHATTISAASYVSRLRANIDTFGLDTPDPAIARVHCPVLAFFGTEERQVGTEDDLAVIRRNAKRARRIDTFMVKGADHDYYGHETEVARRMTDWLASQGIGPDSPIL